MNYITRASKNEKDLLERFLKYVKTYSESNSDAAGKGIIPSTPQQRTFAQMIASEMITIGFSNVQVTEFCYVYGILHASAGYEDKPGFCVLAHLDTVDEVSGRNVNPSVYNDYDGAVIKLSDKNILDPSRDRALAQAAAERDTIITTDGTTLLGADDKAGIAIIMTAVSFIASHKEIKHGEIEVIFSPDEETGHGMDKVPINLISSKRAYTVDGGHIGQLETECFNAVGTTVTFTGKAAHTGDARAVGMINAVSMVSAFTANLPCRQSPETTDKCEGFYAPLEISGNIEKADVYLILRDFTFEGIEKRKKIVGKIAEAVAASFDGGVEIVHKQQYLNMKQGIDAHPEIVWDLERAYRSSGVEPVNTPIRGGTDGSKLTEMGIPAPNIFTGAHNYHSRTEWASLNQMEKAADVIINLARIISGEHNV
jgi:tripeptide aminopeptidase